MSGRRWPVGPAAIIVAAAMLGGCSSYDYLQRTDRVSYHAGDAVKANLERETIDPSNGSMYDTSGLGKNGSVMKTDSPDSAAAGPQTPDAGKTGAPPPSAQ